MKDDAKNGTSDLVSSIRLPFVVLEDSDPVGLIAHNWTGELILDSLLEWVDFKSSRGLME